MKALILAGGELYEPGILRRRIRVESFDIVLGADGGARHVRTLNVTLDAVIGDLDSLPDSERTGIDAEIIAYPVEKDETDLELALLYAGERGASRVVIVGVIGGRMDMSIANVLLAAQTGTGSCKIEVWHGEQTGWVIRPPGEVVTGHPGDTVSLIPLGGGVSGVTTMGLKYSLNDAELRFGSTRGVSNQLEKPSASIKLSNGLLMVIHTPGRA